jgi:1-acyl-sn-glycerol-3-phosphate acyltransferase
MTLEKRDNLHGILQWISKFIMIWHGIPGVKYKHRCNTDESLDGPSVLICNHQSHLDLMALLPLKKKIVVLTNDWVWRNPFYGYVIRQAEFYPVSTGVEALIPKLRNLVDRGYSIAVYPEGTRSEDCRIGRFHQGAFYIAEQLNLDIVPLILYGAGKVLPKKDKHLHRGIISLDVDRHFSPKEVISLGTLKQRASWFRKYYKLRYDEVSDEYERYA